MQKTIAIGCDHGGFDYKAVIKDYLEKEGWTIKDFGTHSQDAVDYPDFAHPVAQAVESGQANYGIVLCGSGNGVAITVNKYAGIRAALCWTKELAQLARQHNDANVLAIPVRFIKQEIALEMVEAFFHSYFEGGRHQRRVDKIHAAQ
ncbi:MAG: ribose 5-phosphate isomerase B [Aureispira sp.]